jgi:hypothetical protein
MTEAEWLESTDPLDLILFLERKPDERKLRLFAAACCRLIWHHLADERLRTAVGVAERFADGLASDGERMAAADLVTGAVLGGENGGDTSARFAVLYTVAHGLDTVSACDAAALSGNEYPAQASLLHDIFGNPFRPVSLDPAWLAWNAGTVRKMGQAIYDDRAFDQLPILADALEEAGCANRDILDHCRSGGDHVRGCWVIDLLLGKG